ncbi:unnamed protein product [Timema podura]|uniref:Transmembrane protein 208 n=1 Tax=Timema podura TaxID=61482 RepID=A0ABN7NH95_TIMPD|nr:unnamed protein product [Timema podura]
MLLYPEGRSSMFTAAYNPQKGKQGTKGQKQILDENIATLNFYRNMVFIANGIYLIVMCVISDSFSWQTIVSNQVMGLFSAAAYISSYQFMAYMAKPTYNDSGQILDSGVDLNMEGGIAEHVKDLIILTTGCQLLSLFSNYFWFLWLLAPIRGFWLLWSNILGPWFFQKQQAQPEVDEKKQRKMERRMKRH